MSKNVEKIENNQFIIDVSENEFAEKIIEQSNDKIVLVVVE